MINDKTLNIITILWNGSTMKAIVLDEKAKYYIVMLDNDDLNLHKIPKSQVITKGSVGGALFL